MRGDAFDGHSIVADQHLVRNSDEESTVYAERSSPHPALRATLCPLTRGEGLSVDRGAAKRRMRGRRFHDLRATISATSSSRSTTISQSAKYERSSPIAIV